MHIVIKGNAIGGSLGESGERVSVAGMEVAVDELEIPADVVHAFVTCGVKRDALEPDDPRRMTIDQFLVECAKRLAEGNTRPRMPAQRRDFVGSKQAVWASR